MPFADFEPSNIGNQTSQNDLGLADGYQSLIVRAQQAQQAASLYPMQKSLLAAQLALAQNDTQTSSLQLQQLTDNMSLEQDRMDAQKAALGAQTATSKATINAQNTYSGLLQSLPQDLQNVQGKIAAATGGSSQSSAPGAAPAAGAGMDFASYQSAKLQLAQLEAKYGGLVASSNNPQLQQVFGQLQAQDKALDFAWGQTMLLQAKPLKANIASATTTDQLRQIIANPMFHNISAIDPSIEGLYDKSFADVQQQEQQSREIAAQQQQKTLELQNQRQLATEKYSRENSIDPATGFQGVAQGTSEGAQKFRDAASAYQDVAGIVNQLSTLADKYQGIGFNNVAGPDKATAQSLSTLLDAHLAKGLFNRTTENELNLLANSVTPDPSKVLSLVSSNKAKLQTVLQVEQASLANKARALGLKPAAGGSTGDGSGGIQSGTTLSP